MNARYWWLSGLALLLIAGFAGVMWTRSHTRGQQAQVASGYAAHVVCSCRYVGNRDMASCKTDLEPGMEIVHISEDAAAKRITASVPLLAERSAIFDPNYGCTLEPEN